MRILAGLLAVFAFAPFSATSLAASSLPSTLRGTGFFDLEKVPFAPQYPLWSDGAAKRRWIHLPPGTSINASDPDAWDFPAGTRLWKQFGYEKPVETRLIERLPDRSWRYATYVWNAAGTDATLAPEEGIDRLPAKGAPDGLYVIPSRNDCVACHEGPAVPVLGFSALQLSPDRDPLAPHADPPEKLDLRNLFERGRIRNFPRHLIDSPPKIAAANATERSVLGYLHANCGHCHNDGALSGIEFALVQQAARPAESAKRAMASLVGHDSRFRAHAGQAASRVVPGKPETSVIAQRMKSLNQMARMPPLGVRVLDLQAIELIERWIRHLEQPKEK